MNNPQQVYAAENLLFPAQFLHETTFSAAIFADEYVFASFYAVFAQAFGIVTENPHRYIMAALGKLPGGEQLSAKFAKPQKEDMLDEAKHDKLMKLGDHLRLHFNEQISSSYTRDFLQGTIIHKCFVDFQVKPDLILRFFADILNELLSAQDGMMFATSLNIDRFSLLMGISEAENRLIRLNLYISTDPRMSIFRDTLLGFFKNPVIRERAYKIMILREPKESEFAEIEHAFSERSKISQLGIVNYSHKQKLLGNMSDFWVYSFSSLAEEEEEFYARFIERNVRKKNFGGAMAKVSNTRDEDLLKEFIKSSQEAIVDYYTSTDERRNKDKLEVPKNFNALIYGASTLDKMGYITDMLDDALEVSYRLTSGKGSKEGDIPGIVYVAQRYLLQRGAGMSAPILIVDHAETALSRNMRRPAWMDMFGGGWAATDEEALDSDVVLLEENPIVTLWITNRPSGITPENVGRFMFHVGLKGGSRAERREEVIAAIRELGYSEATINAISKYLEINPEQVKSAARFVEQLKLAARLEEKEFTHDPEELIQHIVNNSQKALGREKKEELRESVTKYSLDYLNIASEIPIDRLINALKKRQKGSIAMYGLPGTGKTQLAEFIATQLDKPLIKKAASELIDKDIGDSEKRIAGMFQEAKDTDSVLLLDEADSFLRDRSGAHNSWEVTQVNELLVQMESFNGVFLCATNNWQSIDAAALRRFTFKLQFLALDEEQRFKMLVSETDLDITQLSAEDLEKLKTEMTLIKHLTPGDFATVKRQSEMLEEKFPIEVWLNRLNIEAEAKLQGILTHSGYGISDKLKIAQ
jgi:hypothetical protein